MPKEPELDHLLPDDSDLEAVAGGRAPKPFRLTADHPVHGPLTFTMSLPRVAAIARHSVAIDNLLAELNAPARGGTMVLVASIAGVQELMDPVVIDEKTIESDDDDVKAKVERTYYDPQGDFYEDFAVDVWAQASAWRREFTNPEKLAALGKSSGETRGNGSSTPSDAPTASPSTTPA